MEMQRRGYHSLSLPVRGGGEANSNANEPARAGDGTNCDDHFVDAQDFRNMRLAIGTVERNIFEMSLSDNLTGGTRHIDIRLRQNIAPAGNIAGTEEQAAAEPGNSNGSSRIKITVAAAEPDEPDEDKEYLDNMRGWLMTVATLFVGIAFQAAIQQPQWDDGDGNTSASGPAAAAPSPLTAATNKSTAESWRKRIYISTNVTAFVLAMSVLLVLVHLRRTSCRAASRALTAVRCVLPTLYMAVALTFVAAVSTNWKMALYILFGYGTYAGLVIAYMLGKCHTLKFSNFRM